MADPITMFITTGLRKSELLGIQRSGVDLQRKVVRIDGRVSRRPGLRSQPLHPPLRQQPPHPPTIGAIDWHTETVLATVSPGLRTLLNIPDDQLHSPATFPDLIRRFDSWSDRNGILALFDAEESADTWIGTATTQPTQGPRRNLRITARKVQAHNTVRALVCDITNIDSTPAADPVSAALRRAPITPGHALAIIDLRDRLIHEWIAEEPLASWRNRHPEIHPDDAQLIADTCTRLLTGTPNATITARIRFGPNEDWIRLQATSTRITDDNRPQALIDVVFVPH